MRASLNGSVRRYLYHGDRVLEELNDSGTMQARYTTEDGSYYGQWLHLYRTSGTLSRFPMYDNIGTARGLVDASGTVTDTYELDTFGRSVSSSGSTPNPYRFGGAWGYITDPSGFLQLGARYYWPEIGRFISQDPIKDGINPYVYSQNRPLARIDPSGLMTREECIDNCWEDYADDQIHCSNTGIICVGIAQLGWLGGPWVALGGSLGCLAYHENCILKAKRDFEKCIDRCPCE